ncbi:RDD family membrane protein [Malaciobacter marinus]|uniref:RDD family membrane protein n=1 Tax=Malaciobacter marinus TaxID=505249 RepID=A0A347TKP5_9BACT|nr:RDD family protein [Malaciobacter marinus]AXX87173.1 RDD family membrane protein [Malaciobacter marinus]PHO14836.1 RDD family protein [Malaciobacter marinus]
MSELNNSNLELASLRSRALAFVIDDLLITFLIVIVFWDTIVTTTNDPAVVLAIMNQFLWPVLFVKFIYHSFFVWYYGATVGKIIVKIKVIDYNHLGRVSLLNSMFRSAGRILSEMFFYIGFLLGFFSEGRQTFHDKIGRTLIIDV